jgi:putative phosphoesterase
MTPHRIRVGLIADTHGLLRPEAVAALRGSDFIVHAGDIGDAAILQVLAALAPVTAVRGNNDRGPWASALPDAATLVVGETRIHVIHDRATVDPARWQDVDVIVAGHSHRPLIEPHERALFVNPGSAGPRRFKLPVSVGELVIVDERVTARLISLSIPRSASS